MRGSARLGGRLGGSTRRLSLASATWLVGGSSSSRPPSSLLRRLSLVWLRHPRARAHDAARHHARGGYDRDRDGDRRTGGNRREQRRPAVWRRREMQRSYERRRWLRDGRGGGTGWSRRGGSEVIFWVLSPFSFLPAALAQAKPPALRPGPRAAPEGRCWRGGGSGGGGGSSRGADGGLRDVRWTRGCGGTPQITVIGGQIAQITRITRANHHKSHESHESQGQITPNRG